MKRHKVCSLLIVPALLLAGVIVPALFLTGVSGCGGGASEVPTITVKPAEKTGGSITPAVIEPPKNGGPSGGYGTFKGRVTLTGAKEGSLPLAPLATQGKASRDPAVCAAKADIPDESVVVNDGGLANVFIYLVRKPRNGKPKAAHEPTQQLIFDQEGCQFFPHAMVMRTGEAVLVKNSDPLNHNTKNRPKFNQEFNETLGGTAATSELTYKRPERVPVSVECNVHNWMRAYHLPLDHPYAVTTEADGSFEMHDLPVGTHLFKVWHEAAGEIMEYEVTIAKDKEIVEKTISVAASKLASLRGS